MAFMRLYSDKFVAFEVETDCGSCVVPADLIGGSFNVGDEGSLTDFHALETLEALEDYCDGEPVSYTVVEGWFCKFSAPGFTDQTDWVGPYPTEAEAVEECKRLYGDDNDDDMPHDEEDEEPTLDDII